MKNMRISHRIWLSISILMIGYFFSMLYGFIRGAHTELRLNSISTELFPMTMLSQNALSSFNEQINLFNTAIMTGEKQFIVNADEKSTEIVNYLQAIETNHCLSLEKKEKINNLLKQYVQFSETARKVYSIMCEESDMSEIKDIKEQAKKLASETIVIRDILTLSSKTYASDLRQELTQISRTTRNQRIWNCVIFFIVVINSLSFIYLIISRSINQPIKHTLHMLNDIAKGEGNLTARIPVATHDEIGEMADRFNQFISKLQKMMKEITHVVVMLNTSSSQLSSLARQVSGDMEEMTDHCLHVENSTDDMSENIKVIAQTSHQLNKNIANISTTSRKMADNMSDVANTANEFMDMINDISKNAQAGYQISKKASEMAQDAMESMNSLGDAAREIGKVSGVIKRIAVQTNLLALNASIEASTAQEAGLGFAVVAEKIKQFASQSSRSAEDIAHRISDVQNKTKTAIEAIKNIYVIIEEINDSNTHIITAVDNQRQSSKAIAENISEVNHGAMSIANSISNTSAGIHDMSQHAANTANQIEDFASIIHTVKTTTYQSNENVKYVDNSAMDLSNIANQLESLVSKFKV